MVRVDTRLLDGVVKSEKDYSAALVSLLSISDTSLSSITAYASSTTPPVSTAMLAVAVALAGADEALRKYIASVDAWREDLKQIRKLEDEVGNVLRDREILVTRLLKASKGKSARESLMVPGGGSPLQSADNLTIGSVKLSHAQAELQACEKHLAGKERELDQVRRDAVRHGLQRRCQALAECGQLWTERGRDGLRGLESLGVQAAGPPPMQNGHAHIYSQKPLPRPSNGRSRASTDSHISSVTPSQSASQINFPLPSSVPHSPNLATSFEYTVTSPYSIRRPTDGVVDSRSSYTLDIPPAHTMSDHVPTIPPSQPLSDHRRNSSDSDIVGPVEVHENKHIQESLQRPKGKRASTLLAVPTHGGGSSRLSSLRNPPVSGGGGRGSKISRSDLGPSTSTSMMMPAYAYDGPHAADRKQQRSGSFSLLGSIAGFFNPNKKRSASSDARGSGSGWTTRTDQNLASAGRHSSAVGRTSRSKKRSSALGSSSSEDNVLASAPVVVDNRDSGRYLLTSPVALRSPENGNSLRFPKSPNDSPTAPTGKLSKRNTGGGMSGGEERGRQPSVRINGHVSVSGSGEESGEKRKSSLKTTKATKHASLIVTSPHAFDNRMPHDRASSDGVPSRPQSHPQAHVDPREKDKQATVRSTKSSTAGRNGQPTLTSVMEVDSTRNSAATLLLTEVKAPGSVLPSSEVVLSSPKSPHLPHLQPNPAFATGSTGTKAPFHGSTAQGTTPAVRPSSAGGLGGPGSQRTTMTMSPPPQPHAPILKMPQPKPAGSPMVVTTTTTAGQPGSKPATPVLPLRSALRTRSDSPVVQQQQQQAQAQAQARSPVVAPLLPSPMPNGSAVPEPTGVLKPPQQPQQRPSTAPSSSSSSPKETKEVPPEHTNGNGSSSVPAARPRPPPLKSQSSNNSKKRMSTTSESESVYETGVEDPPSSNSDSDTDQGHVATPTRERMVVPAPPPAVHPAPTISPEDSPAPPPPAKLSPPHTDETPRPSTSTQATVTASTAGSTSIHSTTALSNSVHYQVGSQSNSSTSTSGGGGGVGANTTRRKSVRMELVPTIAPTPPAIEYESNDGHVALWTHHPASHQASSHGHSSGGHSHGYGHGTKKSTMMTTMAGGAAAAKGGNGSVPSAWSTRIEISRNAWDDSSEEDETYGEARRALLKAQKRFDRVGDSPSGGSGSKFKNGGKR